MGGQVAKWMGGRAVGNGRYWTDRSRTEMDDTGGENDQTITHNKTIHAGWLSSSSGLNITVRLLTYQEAGAGSDESCCLF